MGLHVVNDTLANNYIRPDESTKAQSRVKEEGKYTFIDKVKVRLVDSDYWAEATNFGHKHLHIPTHTCATSIGCSWVASGRRSTCASSTTRRTSGKNPFWIDKLTPIQIATFDLDEYRRLRRRVHHR